MCESIEELKKKIEELENKNLWRCKCEKCDQLKMFYESRIGKTVGFKQKDN